MLQTGTDALAAHTALVDALSLLVQRYAGVTPASVLESIDHRRVSTMKAVLASNIDTSMTLQSIGEAVGLSPFHAARMFTRHTGMPPHAWRNQARLNQAKTLLRQQTPIAEVAAWCGFTDQSHLTKHFKRAYGVTPGAWNAR
jgi:AraC-like DNA-binding protein